MVVEKGQRGGFKNLDGGKGRKVRIVFSQLLLLLRTGEVNWLLARLFFEKNLAFNLALCPSVCLSGRVCRKTSSHFPILPKLGTKITLIQTKNQAKKLESYDQRVPRSRDPKKPK